MDFKQLVYFESIARLQNMSKAQEELHIAQPALSTSLSRLENQLGVRLFNRTKGRLVLNSYGEVFLRYALQVIEQTNQVTRELERMKKEEAHTLQIAIMDTGFPLPLIADFQDAHPEVQISSDFILYSPQICSRLDEYDLIILPLLPSQAYPAYIPLWERELFLIVPCSHPYFQRTSVPFQDLAGQEICMIGKSSHWSYFLRETLERSGVMPAALRYCLPADLVPLMKKHRAVSVNFREIGRQWDDPSQLRFIPFDPPLRLPIAILFSSLQDRSGASKKFCDFLLQYPVPDSFLKTAPPQRISL